MDSGLHSLLLMASLHGIAADEARLRHAFGAEPFSAQTLLLAAKSLAMKARLVSQPVERLDRAPLPAIGLIVATRFEALLTDLRTYVFAHTSSKIDVELGARLLRHLLNLSISSIQARRVGQGHSNGAVYVATAFSSPGLPAILSFPETQLSHFCILVSV